MDVGLIGRDVTAKRFCERVVSMTVGVFEYELKPVHELRENGRTQLAIADYTESTIEINSALHGRPLLHAVFEVLAEVYDWHYPFDPATAADRHKAFASMMVGVIRDLEGIRFEPEFDEPLPEISMAEAAAIVASDQEKSGSPKEPVADLRGSDHSDKARTSTAA